MRYCHPGLAMPLQRDRNLKPTVWSRKQDGLGDVPPRREGTLVGQEFGSDKESVEAQVVRMEKGSSGQETIRGGHRRISLR
jgi:hypothetical protein